MQMAASYDRTREAGDNGVQRRPEFVPTFLLPSVARYAGLNETTRLSHGLTPVATLFRPLRGLFWNGARLWVHCHRGDVGNFAVIAVAASQLDADI